MELAAAGIDVICHFDPLQGKRHHTKRIAVKHKAIREKNKLISLKAKAGLLRYGRLLGDADLRPDGFDLAAAKEEAKNLQSILKKADTASLANILNAQSC